MNVSMMQPTFLPWLGYFELIEKSDVFVFLDDFQFSVQSYHQRNRLFVNKGQIGWYSVPVKKSISFQRPLNKTQINEEAPWRKKFWKRIRQNYEKADYFNTYAKVIEQWLLRPAENLAEQNIAFIVMVGEMLGLERSFRRSSECPSDRQRSERVLELLRWCDGDRYYCAGGSFDYMLQDRIFPVPDIHVLFQDFHPREYRQLGSSGSHVPYLCVLDALFNVGPDKTLDLIRNGTSQWHTWEEMAGLKNHSQGDEH
jgi:hypothetical protein